VRDPNSAHEMSELNYYSLQQSYTTELKDTINSHAIYIYPKTKAQRQSTKEPVHTTIPIQQTKSAGAIQQLQENHKVSKH